MTQPNVFLARIIRIHPALAAAQAVAADLVVVQAAAAAVAADLVVVQAEVLVVLLVIVMVFRCRVESIAVQKDLYRLLPNVVDVLLNWRVITETTVG
jgi:hypothetical protein